MTALLLAVGIFAAMIGEAVLARRNDRALRAQGAFEPAGDVYRAMQVAYPGVFIAMIAEGAWRRVAPDALFTAGLIVLMAGKAIKYWAIATLGSRWSFRVLVPPGSQRVARGPYTWLAHPNYVGVAGEIAGCGLAMHALITGPIAFVTFGVLMLRRIRVEEAALAAE